MNKINQLILAMSAEIRLLRAFAARTTMAGAEREILTEAQSRTNTAAEEAGCKKPVL